MTKDKKTVRKTREGDQLMEGTETTAIIFFKPNFIGLAYVRLKLPIIAFRIDLTKNTDRSIFGKI